VNLRHATALALVGWYLMVPPLSDTGIDAQVPMAQWNISGSYDTASDCEASKNRMDDMLRDPTQVARIKAEALKEGKDWDPHRAIARSEASKCVATDDPRLKN
jgi:hypothetical protein